MKGFSPRTKASVIVLFGICHVRGSECTRTACVLFTFYPLGRYPLRETLSLDNTK